jgi:tryptophan synthase alpha chain
MHKPNRLENCFTDLKLANKKAFIPYISAGYPDYESSLALFKALPDAGADIIELGMPFSDPMADGPIIQAANTAALTKGITTVKILQMVTEFRKADDVTPIVLMGYYNPIYSYGIMRFLDDAEKAGVDGFIIPDLPPEEDAEFRIPAYDRNMNIIRLATPTTDAERLPTVLKDASGFLYCVAVAGTTGGQSADPAVLCDYVKNMRLQTDLPVAIGFGVNTPEQAKAMATAADGVIVASAIIKRITAKLDDKGEPRPSMSKEVIDFVAQLATAVHSA